jgi:hypothetical protein
MAADAAYLQAQAVRMFQFAIATRDAELSQELTNRAIGYLDQAMEIERELQSQRLLLALPRTLADKKPHRAAQRSPLSQSLRHRWQ